MTTKNKKKSAKGKDAPEEKSCTITQAIIKDDFCNYSYIVTEGTGKGDKVTVKGVGIVDDDMKRAFGKLNVHLAIIDDVFKHKNIEIDNISNMHTDETTILFQVDGFKIKGGEDEPLVVLIGSKYLSTGGRMELESPPINMGSLSGYKWHKELKKSIDKAVEEVELYMAGKYTIQEEEEVDDSEQLKITEDNN